MTAFSIEWIKSVSHTLSYRVAFPRTSCGIVFIPLNRTNSKYCQNALHYFTLAHKNDQKLQKCIGVVIFNHPEFGEHINIYRLYNEGEWKADQEMEGMLRDNFPFRTVTHRTTEGYDFSK